MVLKPARMMPTGATGGDDGCHCDRAGIFHSILIAGVHRVRHRILEPFRTHHSLCPGRDGNSHHHRSHFEVTECFRCARLCPLVLR